MIFLYVFRLAVNANERCLIVAHNNIVINLNINDSFISSRNISMLTSAATVMKDSQRGHTKTIYTLQILPTNHTPTHSTSINGILLFRCTTYQQRQLLDPVELSNHAFAVQVKNYILYLLFFLLFLIVFYFFSLMARSFFLLLLIKAFSFSYF